MIYGRQDRIKSTGALQIVNIYVGSSLQIIIIKVIGIAMIQYESFMLIYNYALKNTLIPSNHHSWI